MKRGGGETWVLILPLLSPGLPICKKQKLGWTPTSPLLACHGSTSLLGGGGRTLDMMAVHFRDRAEKRAFASEWPEVGDFAPCLPQPPPQGLALGVSLAPGCGSRPLAGSADSFSRRLKVCSPPVLFRHPPRSAGPCLSGGSPTLPHVTRSQDVADPGPGCGPGCGSPRRTSQQSGCFLGSLGTSPAPHPWWKDRELSRFWKHGPPGRRSICHRRHQ